MTVINQYVVPHSQRFLDNIRKELPEDVKEFELINFGMKKASGYGSYYYIMDCIINGNKEVIKQFTHDSMNYDYYTDLEYLSHKFDNWVKRKVLYVLSVNCDRIIDVLSNEI